MFGLQSIPRLNLISGMKKPANFLESANKLPNPVIYFDFVQSYSYAV